VWANKIQNSKYRRCEIILPVGQASRLSVYHPLSPWRERVRVRGINLHVIRDTIY